MTDRIDSGADVRQAWATDYLRAEGGRVPCSRYGWDAASCAPVAVAVAFIVAAETGEPVTTDALDYAMGLVVNDHDDPEYLIREYGREHGFDPGDLLD